MDRLDLNGSEPRSRITDARAFWRLLPDSPKTRSEQEMENAQALEWEE